MRVVRAEGAKVERTEVGSLSAAPGDEVRLALWASRSCQRPTAQGGAETLGRPGRFHGRNCVNLAQITDLVQRCRRVNNQVYLKGAYGGTRGEEGMR